MPAAHPLQSRAGELCLPSSVRPRNHQGAAPSVTGGPHDVGRRQWSGGGAAAERERRPQRSSSRLRCGVWKQAQSRASRRGGGRRSEISAGQPIRARRGGDRRQHEVSPRSSIQWRRSSINGDGASIGGGGRCDADAATTIARAGLCSSAGLEATPPLLLRRIHNRSPSPRADRGMARRGGGAWRRRPRPSSIRGMAAAVLRWDDDALGDLDIDHGNGRRHGCACGLLLSSAAQMRLRREGVHFCIASLLQGKVTPWYALPVGDDALCEHWILEMQNCICTLYWMDAGDAKLQHTLLHSVLRKVGWHFTRAEQNVVVPLERRLSSST
jgi:hypothetical protein